MIIELKLNFDSSADDRNKLLAALRTFNVEDLGESHLPSSRRYELEPKDYRAFAAACENIDCVDCIRFVSGPEELRPRYPR